MRLELFFEVTETCWWKRGMTTQIQSTVNVTKIKEIIGFVYKNRWLLVIYELFCLTSLVEID